MQRCGMECLSHDVWHDCVWLTASILSTQPYTTVPAFRSTCQYTRTHLPYCCTRLPLHHTRTSYTRTVYAPCTYCNTVHTVLILSFITRKDLHCHISTSVEFYASASITHPSSSSSVGQFSLPIPIIGSALKTLTYSLITHQPDHRS